MSIKRWLPILMMFLVANCTPEESSVATPTALPVATSLPRQNLVERFISIPYAENHERQKLDVYMPTTGEGPFPTILAIHGGAFRTRSKALYQLIGPHFAEKGYAFVAINYRLLPADHYPAQVADSFCALAWLHANHEAYGFDPSRVVVWGGSAGGYLASMLATIDEPDPYLQSCPHEYPSEAAMQAAVVFYGFFDFVDIGDYPTSEVTNLTQFWGAEHETLSTEQLVEMSPIRQIDGSEPPFILLHGTADDTIPSVMSERFADALAQAGVEVELVLLPGVGHAFELRPLQGEEMSVALNEIESFLNEVIVPR